MAMVASVVLGCHATMLILDVMTQWSSIHQMLRKVLSSIRIVLCNTNVVARSCYGLS